MKGMTFDEFKETLAKGWEIDFEVNGLSYHYQRSGAHDLFKVYLTSKAETLYEAKTSNMESVVKAILSLKIYDGKTLKQMEDEITVISSS